MDHQEIELNERRAIIAIPKNTVRIDIDVTVALDGTMSNVSKVMNSADVYEAFRRADMGYLHEDDDTGEEVTCADGEAFALIYLPEESVAVTLNMIQMVNHKECPPLEYELTLHDLYKAFTEADFYYIDDDDKFVLTDKGREWFEQMGRIQPVR